MRRVFGSLLVIAPFMLVGSTASGQDAAHAVTGGGVSAPGWTGKADANRGGMTVDNSKFAKEGNEFHVTTGPATTWWNPNNKASGDYTVKATFTEPKFMNLMSHPHPYGIMIAGNDLGTDQASMLYCAAYGDGRFIVRGFGPAAFALNGREGEENAAVHKAAGKDEPVTQNVAMSVKGNKVSCSINGTEVWSADKSTLVTAGKLKSTDGVYGIRFAHNTEGIVKDFTMTKP